MAEATALGQAGRSRAPADPRQQNGTVDDQHVRRRGRRLVGPDQFTHEGV